MTTNEYLIKRILDLESENERLKKLISNNEHTQHLINEVSDQIEIHTLKNDKTIVLNVSKNYDESLYNTCMKLFDLDWKEEICHDSNKK